MSYILIDVPVACNFCGHTPSTGQQVYAWNASGTPDYALFLCKECQKAEEEARRTGEVLDQSPSPPPVVEALFIY